MLRLLLRASRRGGAAALLLVAAGATPATAQAAGSAASEAADHAHRAARPFDLHIDLPATGDAGQLSAERAASGGLAAVALAVFAPQGPDTPEALAAARHEAEARHAAIEALIAAAPGRLALATTAQDIEAHARAGRVAVVKAVVNGGAFAPSVEDIDAWAARGVRIFGLVHAGHNALADSSRPSLPRGDCPSRWNGLSPAGRAAIARLNELGVLVDVSQLSDTAFDEALGLSRVPVVASHSSARALVPHARNLTDAQLLRLRDKGGVVGINAFSAYVRQDDPATARRHEQLIAEFGLDRAGGQALPPGRAAEYTRRYYAIRSDEPKATLAQFVDHVDHAVRLVGIEHVALSSDFNHGGGVTGWSHVGETPAVTAELLRRGYQPDQIRQLWSGNILRLLRQAEAAAAAAPTAAAWREELPATRP